MAASKERKCCVIWAKVFGRLAWSASRLGALCLVDDRVSKDPIEPADGGLVDLATASEPPNESVLQKLFGDSPIADPSLDVTEKLAMVLDQKADELGTDVRFFFCRLVSHAAGT